MLKKRNNLHKIPLLSIHAHLSHLPFFQPFRPFHLNYESDDVLLHSFQEIRHPAVILLLKKKNVTHDFSSLEAKTDHHESMFLS